MGSAAGDDEGMFTAQELWFSGRSVIAFNLAALAAARPELVGHALGRAVEAVGAGKLRIELRDRIPLERAAAAHRMIESGGGSGKLVLAVEP
jgi:NADPH2:quinone reductase